MKRSDRRTHKFKKLIFSKTGAKHTKIETKKNHTKLTLKIKKINDYTRKYQQIKFKMPRKIVRVN